MLGSFGVDSEPSAVGDRGPIDVRQVILGCGEGGCPSGAFDCTRFDGVLGFGEGVSGVLASTAVNQSGI